MIKPVVLWSSLSIFFLLLFAVIAHAVLMYQTQSLDVAISTAVYAIRTPFLTPIMFAFTFLGEVETIAIGAAIITAFFIAKQHKHEAYLFASLLISGGLLNIILKDIFHRPRPTISPLIDLSATYSFPSGHAMASCIYYIALLYFVFHFTKNKTMRIFACCLASVFILLIGFSRVYLGVHYPSDVLAGYIAGFFIFTTVLLFDKSILLFRIKKEK